jgi:hypothetical protein
MLRLSLSLLLLLASAAQAQDAPEDQPHRADRERTEQLNHRALEASRPRVSPADLRAYQAARARYQAEMRAWRERSGACEAGDRQACR